MDHYMLTKNSMHIISGEVNCFPQLYPTNVLCQYFERVYLLKCKIIVKSKNRLFLWKYSKRLNWSFIDSQLVMDDLTIHRQKH